MYDYFFPPIHTTVLALEYLMKFNYFLFMKKHKSNTGPLMTCYEEYFGLKLKYLSELCVSVYLRATWQELAKDTPKNK